MATNVVKTYVNQIKPVGEKVLLNYVRAARAGAVDDDFDFVLDSNYYVSGLELTKTGADLGTTIGDSLTACVLKVDEAGIGLTMIAQAQFAVTDDGLGAAQQTGFQGQKMIAGNPVPIPSAGAAVTVVPVSAIAPLTDGSSVPATWLDPTVVLQADVSKAGTSNAKQRMRLKIKSAVASATVDPSCFVTIKLSRYAAGITQGSTGTNGNVVSEVVIPNLP